MTRLLAATALTLALPFTAQAQEAGTVVATVNGTDITLGHVVAMRDRLPGQYQELPDDVLYQGLVDQLVQQQVLADAARAEMSAADTLGLENETRAFLASRVIEKAAAGSVDDAAVQAAYEARFAAAEPQTEWNASHILVETETEARAIKARLDDGADFEAVAREESTGPSGPNGGQLGWFGPGQMVPAFEEAVTGMEAGQVSDPVQTQFGWHVVRLNETRDRAAPPLDQVRGEIEQELQTQAIDETVQRLVEAAEVDRPDVEVDPAAIRDDALIDG